MGIVYQLGPPAATLDPRRPDGLDPWCGDRELSFAQLDELVRVVEAAGWWVDRGADEIAIVGRLGDDEDGDFEEFVFSVSGGYLSKPSRDDDEADRQLDLLYAICDYAGWVAYDPQEDHIMYGVEVRCGHCDLRVPAGRYQCDDGHPATDARLDIHVKPPSDLPTRPPAPGPPPAPFPRELHHPDGRRWIIRTRGPTLELVIALPDGSRVERRRRFPDADAALLEMQLRIDEQLADGFVEVDSTPD